MTLTVFITGTDTEVGKTWAACGLLRAAAARGLKVAGFKPVAAGCEEQPEGLRNEDALALLAASNIELTYEQVNPVALPAAIAPHLAARQARMSIDTDLLRQAYDQLAARADLVVVEGAGGWLVPLDSGTRTLADWVVDNGWPVVLVVGMRLGCINHALLSAQVIAGRARLVGWLGNCLPPVQPYLRENLQTLQQRLPAPCLGVLGESGDAAGEVDIQALLQAL